MDLEKKKKHRRKSNRGKIDIEQIILHHRQIFLFKEICHESAYEVVTKLIALDHLDSSKPIGLYINSPGGSVDAGFSIIDAMKGILAPVLTIITGEACSMAAVISIAGDTRYMTGNSVWMSHDMAGGIWGDYTTKVLDRADYLKQEQSRLVAFIRNHTKLSEAELVKGTHGELWLYPKECLKKGIVDKILQ